MLIVQVVYLLYLLPYLISSSAEGDILNMENVLSIDATRGGAVITPEHPLVVATRLHLGKAAKPPADLEEKMNQFADFCYRICAQAVQQVQATDDPTTPTGPLVVATVAVDATPKLDNYDLLQAVRQISDQIAAQHRDDGAVPPGGIRWSIQVVPVQPWGRFVPALNALVMHAATNLRASRIMFVSAETTTVGVNAIARLLKECMSDHVAVVGARLTGHDHSATGDRPQTVELNGRTTPWNTLAVWNVPKLALTGFQLISDGLLSDLTPPPVDGTTPLINMGGVEETVTIALLQKLLGPTHAVAKLLAVPDVTWNEKFDDPARQEWHDQKMASKVSRAQRQMDLLGLTGEVQHLAE